MLLACSLLNALELTCRLWFMEALWLADSWCQNHSYMVGILSISLAGQTFTARERLARETNYLCIWAVF